MAKCANCANEAYYSVENPGAQHQAFCKEHLPKILNPLRLPPYVKEIGLDTPAPAVTPAATKTKKKEAVEKIKEPAPVIEETTPAPVEVEAVAEVAKETPEVTE
jgi:hypothetical protein